MIKEAGTERPAISVIIPTLNEAPTIRATLESLAPMRKDVEIVVADGGSDDLTAEVARNYGAQVISSQRGRGLQMHNGSCGARGEVLLFLHADTVVPTDAADQIMEALARDATAVGGNFRVHFDGDSHAARFLTWFYPRLRKFGVFYGDSGIFVRTSAYREVGGFNSFPIFEDLDLVRRLRRHGRLVHLPAAVVTSSRRFEGRSFALTFARWSILQVLYWAGISPRVLNQLYAPVRSARAKNLRRKCDDQVWNYPQR